MAEGRDIKVERDAIGNTMISGDGNVVIVQASRSIEYTEAKPSPIGPNPYKGLSAFNENDSDRFFGRETLTVELWQKFRALHEPAPGAEPPIRLLPILGPSGSGKSSLARAGLIPELARRPLPGFEAPRVAIFTPGAHPCDALGAVLARVATDDAAPVAKAREFADELRRANPEGEFDGLRRIAEALPNIAQSPLIVLVDQFEEIYSLCDNADERRALIRNLLNASHDRAARVSVILTLRSDFLGATIRIPKLNQIISRQGVIVPVMSEEELRRTISEPAAHAGHPLEDATIELLVSEIEGRQGALPLLQFVLTRIWEGLGQGVTPGETMRRLGGVGGAIAGEAQQLYNELSDKDKEIARRAFLSLVQLGEGARDTRRRAPISEIVAEGEDANHVLDVLRAFARPGERLITLSAESGNEVSAEVTHEALFEHWTSLQGWLVESRDQLRFHHRLAEAAKEWDTAKRPNGSLWRPPALDLLEDHYAKAKKDLTETQVAFYKASRRQHRRAQWLRRGAVAGLGLLFVAAAGLAGLAEWQRGQAELWAKDAEQQRDEARRSQSLFLADLSEQQTAKGDTTTGALLALQALFPFIEDPRHYVPQAEMALYRAVLGHRERQVLAGHGGWVDNADFSPDGKWVVTASRDKTARIWDAATGQTVRTLEGHEGSVARASFSSDGNLIATTSADHTARLWDRLTGSVIAVIHHDLEINNATFSPDGRLILTSSADGTAGLWDARDGQAIATLGRHGGSGIIEAVFSADGARVATACADGTAQVWDVGTGALVAELKGHKPGIALYSARFSADGALVVTSSRDWKAIVWDAASGERLFTLSGHSSSVKDAAFSPDGLHVATVSEDGTGRIWTLEQGLPFVVLVGDGGEVNRVVYSPDGRRILAASGGGTAFLWDAVDGRRIAALGTHKNWVNFAGFSKDGRQAITTSRDHTARIWDATLGGNITIHEDVGGLVTAAAFSRDGSRLATGGIDGMARIREVASGKDVATFGGDSGEVSGLAFSPDGSQLAIASDDGTVSRWNVASQTKVGVIEGSGDPLYHVEFSADGAQLLTASYDRTARIRDAASGRQMAVLEGHASTVTAAAFSPDGQRVATASEDRTARLWDAASGQETNKLEGHANIVTAINLAPDGKRLVTASEDRTARLWNAVDGSQIAVLSGHQGAVKDAVFSPDGSRVATASGDGSARLWDASTGSPVALFADHNTAVERVTFTPDSEHVITVAEDGAARIWPVQRTTQALIASACSMFAGAELSAEQRERFFLSTDGSTTRQICQP